MNIDQLANVLTTLNENIILIYAFNATGKTRLSVAYKNATKDEETGKHAGVYYNAFSEDLFVWENDEENDGVDIKLKILPSRLNNFHSFLCENSDFIISKLAPYNPQYNFRLNPYNDPEKGIESISFYLDRNEGEAIKISRGEERIFVWCFYLALLEVDGWASEQDTHIFIDDPVSSLDEHNIFVTADSIFQQIENHYEKKRIIITTHHIGLFSILADRLTKGEKSGRYRNLTAIQILKKDKVQLALDTPNRNVFLFHLHLLQVLGEASRLQLYTYHFSMLRQVLENISSFLGTGKMSHTLSLIGIERPDDVANIINTHSHKSVYYFQTELMSSADEKHFRNILNGLNEKYQFVY